ncbi:MAG: hypothetical protein J5I59_08780 [Saprospiraceae bacterium]|nr:hypothetical protein [Saprospiraceae bacterium]
MKEYLPSLSLILIGGLGLFLTYVDGNGQADDSKITITGSDIISIESKLDSIEDRSIDLQVITMNQISILKDTIR